MTGDWFEIYVRVRVRSDLLFVITLEKWLQSKLNYFAAATFLFPMNGKFDENVFVGTGFILWEQCLNITEIAF